MTDVIQDFFSISGKTAVLTGGAKGIGAMIRTALVRAGVKVFVLARTGGEDFAEGTGSCTFLQHDLSTNEGVAAAAADVAARTSEVNILINNAGVLTMTSIDALSPEQWDMEMAVNVRAPFYLVQSLLPLLKAGKRDGDPARVINIGSIAALWAKSSSAYAYSASKGGLHQLTRALASDLTKEGITVNAIAPGFFPSDLTDGFFSAAPGIKEAVISGIPAGRLGSPMDIGGAVIFLSSPAAAYISGTILPVEGALCSA
jgi:NAD(P)-dependent dehydrogenase (short-subunit alcohol dehydrogenase family)